MTIESIRLGASGTIIEATIKEDGVVVDVSDAEAKSILLKSPSGESFVRAATFTTDGTDGKVRFIDTNGALFGDKKLRSRIGTWSACIEITGLSGWSGTSQDFQFEVTGPLHHG